MNGLNLNEVELLGKYATSKQLQIERLLRQYSNTLEDVHELLPQLRGTITEQRKATQFGTEPVFFTPAEAAQMGLGLQEGYLLKISPTQGNGGYTSSVITPTKWEITEDDYYISPSGQRLSAADMQAWLSEPTGQVIPEGWEFPTGPLTIENLTEEGKSAYQEYQQSGGKLGIEDWIDLRERQQLETEEVFGAVFPEQDIQEVLDYMSEDPEGFLADVREIGPTEDMITFLKFLEFKDAQTTVLRHGRPIRLETTRNLTDAEIQDIFGTTPVPEYVPESWLKDNVWDAFIAPVVSVLGLGIKAFPSIFTSATESLAPELAKVVTLPIEAPIGGWAYMASNILGQPEKELLQTVPKTTEQTVSWLTDTFVPGLQEKCKNNFMRLMEDNEAWIQEHPELNPNPAYLENPFEHPELLKDPGYWAYSISSTLGYSLSVMGVLIGVSAVATPAAGIPAAMMVAAGPEATTKSGDEPILEIRASDKSIGKSGTAGLLKNPI